MECLEKPFDKVKFVEGPWRGGTEDSLKWGDFVGWTQAVVLARQQLSPGFIINYSSTPSSTCPTNYSSVCS